MPLDENGYTRPTYEDLYLKYSERARLLFGDDIDLSGTSTMGKIVQIMAYKDADTYEDIESVYYSAFPHSARGQSLDRLMPFAGIYRNPQSYARRKIRITGEPGYQIEAGSAAISGSINFIVEDPATINEAGSVDVICICEQGGTIGNRVVIDQMQEQVMEISSVEDLGLVEAGKAAESDTAGRVRFDQSVSGGGSGTFHAIRSSIMRVEQVSAVNIIENDTDQEVNGIPARGFKCYVLAPETQDQLVAEAIFDKKPVGIPCVGDVLVKVCDDGGLEHGIRFSHSQEVPIFVRIHIKVNSFFETEGLEQIKSNLNEYVYGLSNGDPVILSALYGYIHSVAGVAETTLLQLSKDGVNYVSQNIVVLPYEIARLSIDNIEVVVTGD